MYALTRCKIYTSDLILDHHAILIAGDKIVDIIPEKSIPTHYQCLDLQGHNIAPGFIDMQINGCGGRLFNDHISAGTLDVMRRTNLRSGTTSFLPTLISSDDNDIKQALAVTQAYRKQHQNTVLGLHLEGPYINKAKRGLHDERCIRPPDEAMVTRIARYGAGVVKMITVAPEVMPPRFIRQLQESGIVIAAGHSHATFKDAVRGFEAGITMATHLFNAMPSISGRNPGLITAILENENVYASIIVDGVHVDYASIHFVKQIKKDKLCLVTDAMAPVGTGINYFMFGDRKIYCRDGKCISTDGVLSGSMLTLDKAILNCLQNTDIELDECLRMASTYPAKIVSMEHKLGSIAKNYIANLVVFDSDIRIAATVINGKYNEYSQIAQWSTESKAI